MTGRDPDRPVCPDMADDGRPQALREKCQTCILQRAGSSIVGPDVVRDLIARHIAVGAVIVCHSTLPDIPGNRHDAVGYAACRGFLDSYGDRVAGARIVRPVFADPDDPDDDGWHLVDLPAPEEP